MFEKKNYESLEQLLEENRVFYHFAKLCQIPHPSFKEKRLSDYLLGWATERGLYAAQDVYNNVFIKKSGTPGYEDAPAVMIQAHIDMVCEKTPETDHDFDTDPIRIRLDGDLLSTGGRTTLGADDGIGVAYAMAILEADDIPHPPLEVLFTTAEEEDLSGAQNVDASSFQARLLINIDNAVEHELLSGSCGGIGVEVTLPAGLGPVPYDCPAYRVSVSGLPGGHSGEDIHRGHGNANILLGRFLYACEEEFPVRIGELAGGSFRLAIPREAQALLYIPAEKEERFLEIAEQKKKEFFREYEAVAPDFTVSVLKVESRAALAEDGSQTSLSGESSQTAVPGTASRAAQPETDRRAALPEAAKKLIQALYLSPNGISDMNNAVAGVVESSDNLGELRYDRESGQFILVYEIRASFESTREYLYEKLQILAKLLGGTCRGFADYPSWSFNPHSMLREKAAAVYEREFGEKMHVKAVHAGLECGCLMPKMPGLDAISIGPDAWGLHSPQERLSVSSTDRMYRFIKELLAELR